MKKISTKLNISMLALVILILAFIGGALIINMSVDYHRQFESTASRVLEKELPANDLQAITLYLESQMPLFNDCCDFYIFQDGNIVASSRQGGVLKLTPTLAAAIGAKNPQGSALDYAKKIDDNTAIYLKDSRKQLSDDIFDITILFLQALAVTVVLAAVISYFISKKLTGSINELEKGARRMSEGEFTRIEVGSKDEIGSLCKVFNEMGEQIQTDFDRFEQEENSRREFVANVSHELKTPLTVIKSYSETLSNMDLDKQTQKNFLNVISSEVDRMTDIVGQLLQLSKLETEQASKQEKVDVRIICEQIVQAFLIDAGKKGVTFNINGECVITTQVQKLKTIVTNLISNAVKYSDKDSEITISLDTKSVTVTNLGIGIDQKDLPHIFDRFYRTDPARNRETGGTGLGLAIAKESAAAIGAKLLATSVPGEYTEFKLEF